MKSEFEKAIEENIERNDFNNSINKRRFFGLYIDQKVLRWHQWLESVPSTSVDFCIPKVESDGWYLHLKKISSITEEDAIEVGKVLQIDNFSDEMIVEEVKSWLNDGFSFGRISHKWECMKILDLLRKRGYLVSFDGFSDGDLISFGWAKTE